MTDEPKIPPLRSVPCDPGIVAMFPDGVVARSGYRMRSAERDGAMTETTAEIIAKALFEDSAGHDPSCLTWEKMKARHGLEYEGVSRFYRRAAAVIKALGLEL